MTKGELHNMPIIKKRKKTQQERSVTIKIPEKMFINIRDLANEEYRSISQQARMLLDIGFSHFIAATQESEYDEQKQELESCIGFRVERGEEQDDEE